jgi:hypothetical protein
MIVAALSVHGWRFSSFASDEGLCAWEDFRGPVVVVDTRMRSNVVERDTLLHGQKLPRPPLSPRKYARVALDHPKYACLNRSVFDSSIVR